MAKQFLAAISNLATTGKSLKDQNRWQLWLVVAANTLFLYVVIQANAIALEGFKSIFTQAHNIVTVGFAVLITTVLSNFLSADTKARIVFLRWHHALPGHRAFTVYGLRDSRVDLAVLSRSYGPDLPTDPAAQNRLWYRIFRIFDHAPPISQLHRDFLLLRDYTGIALLFVITYGIFALFFIDSGRVCSIYISLLIVQLVIVRQAALHSGTRLVTNVLAMASTSSPQMSAKG